MRLTLLAIVICSLWSPPPMVLQPLVGKGLLTVKTSLSQTPHTW